ncbi:pyridoxamine 5'-phosphate oxidase [Pseudokineococcus sp. 1T1Z-3]|uniref:pyridoxamine 5'-phosphate oxidase n=1 Tax=Pseudokineococcus sp. 1T1Z-3 TaxID=3132745 RepID=UPI00309CC1B0
MGGGGGATSTWVQERLRARGRASGISVLAAAVVISPTWSLVDRVLEGQALADSFLPVRLLALLPMAAALLLLWRTPLGRRWPGATTAAGLGVLQLEIGWMLPQVQTLGAYLLGASLVFYAAGSVLATRPLWTAGLLLPTVVGTLWGSSAGAGLGGADLVLTTFYLGTAGVVGVVGQTLRYRSSRAELTSRRELELEQLASRRLLRELRRLSTEDPLTGLLNRRQWDHELSAACARAATSGSGVALVLLDVDHFKSVNDRAGHAGGDEVLRRTADLLRAVAEPGDVVARLGGDELALLMPGGERERAETAAEQVRRQVEALRLPTHPDLRVTCSLGVAVAHGTTAAPVGLVLAADDQLYLAKVLRNAVASAGDGDPRPHGSSWPAPSGDLGGPSPTGSPQPRPTVTPMSGTGGRTGDGTDAGAREGAGPTPGPGAAGSVVDPRARITYTGAGLDDDAPLWHADPPLAPLELLEAWYAEVAADERVTEPGAVVLATVDADGAPDARTVLLKELDGRGAVVYTNLGSAKGRQLDAVPRAALVLPWQEASRQVRLRGHVERTTRAQSQAYFASRPRGSQLAAWASAQSQPVAGRAELERRVAELEERFAGREVPLPDGWGGVRVLPTSVELWAGRASRLHDRAVWTSRTGGPARLDDAAAWRLERLQP